MDEVRSKVYLLLEKFLEYNRSYKVYEEEALAKQEEALAKQKSVSKIPQLEKEYKKAVEDFQISKDVATDIVKCLDGIAAE